MTKLAPKTFNILFIGDLFAKVGRNLIRDHLSNYQTKYAIDLTILNGENATHGCSLSFKHYQQLIKYGVDVITLGNHTFHRSEINEYINQAERLIRPHNLPLNRPGKSTLLIKKNGLKIQITNLIGNTYMDTKNTDLFTSFLAMDDQKADLNIIDLHAEATAEKAAFAWAFDGKVTAVLGTHTHVQTNDARLLPKKTFFITDVGMTGPYNSIIGAKPEYITQAELTGKRKNIIPAEGVGQFSAVIFKIDYQTKRVVEHKTILDIISN